MKAASQHRTLTRYGVIAALAIMLGLGALWHWRERADGFWDNAHHARLDNGMDIIVLPDRRADVVTHMVWYRVGSSDEPIGKSGLAHYVEHLMFKGTDNVAAGQFSKTIAALGGQDNAFTSYDYTAYYQRLAPRHLGRAMQMEADRMRHLRLADAALASERDVVLEERAMRVDGNPQALFDEKLRARLYAGHPYGVPIIGWRGALEKLTRADAEQFYRRHYAPQNAILIIVGNVDMAQILPLARRYYGAISMTHAATKRPARNAPPPLANPHAPIIHRDARARTRIYSRSYRLPAWSRAAARDFAALDILVEILGGDESARLYDRLVRRDKIAVQAYGWTDSLRLGAGELTFRVILRGEDKADEALNAELARVQNQLVSAAELARAKARLLSDAIYARDNQQTLAQILGMMAVLGRDTHDLKQWHKDIAALDAMAVREAARRFLRPEVSLSGYVTP